jgi:hypothetical protein
MFRSYLWRWYAVFNERDQDRLSGECTPTAMPADLHEGSPFWIQPVTSVIGLLQKIGWALLESAASLPDGVVE